jgi:ankyrin repeat protein
MTGCASFNSPSAAGPEWRAAFAGAKRNTARYPMMVMRLADALAITAEDGLPPHQLALKRGLLHAYTPGDGAVLFVSHQVGAACRPRLRPCGSARSRARPPPIAPAPDRRRAPRPRGAQWLGDEHPDPAFVQFGVLQSALRLLAAGKTDVQSHPQLVVTGGSIKMLGAEFEALLAPPNVFVWCARARSRPARRRARRSGVRWREARRPARARARCPPRRARASARSCPRAPPARPPRFDYFSVPQPSVSRDRATLENTRAAIMSIPYYVREATHVLILAPGAARDSSEGGALCDYWTWMQRGWCRLECMAHALGSRDASARPPLLVQQARDICFCSPFDYLTRPVGRGSYSVPSDRAVVAPVLWSILDKRIESRLARADLDGYRWARAMRSHLMAGVPIGSAPEHAVELLHEGERTWAEFKAAYRFDGPRDDARGYAPLRYAVMSNNVAVARELLALGADVHALTPAQGNAAIGTTGGDSVLATAMQTCGGHFDASPMLELLIDARADINFKSATTGNGLLVEAAVWVRARAERARARTPCLCRPLAPARRADSRRPAPPRGAARPRVDRSRPPTPQGNCDTMRALFARWPPAREPQLCEAAGPILNTPVLACALIGQEQPAYELVRAGVSCRGANFLGWRALHHAAHWGWSGMVELLLQTDARVDIDALVAPPLTVRGWPNTLGASVLFRGAFFADDGPKQALVLRCLGGAPVHCAVAGDQWMCARILVDARADPSVRSREGLTPLELALALGERADLVVLLREAADAHRSGRPSIISPNLPSSLIKKA